MSSRFITGALTAILGGFVVVVSQAFSPGVLSWVAFGITAGVIVIVLVSQLDPARGAIQRVLDACSIVVSGLLVGFGLAASGRLSPGWCLPLLSAWSGPASLACA